MPDLLFEVFSEEIPARMQAQAAEDLRKLVTQALVDRGLTYEGAASFATPRRLALHIAGLPTQQPDVREEKKGPRVGAPDAAVQGFLKSAGLTSLDQATIESDPKKGEFYVAIVEKKGGATIDVLAEILPSVLKNFPWPKSMRWGVSSSKPESLRWVRPMHSIVATFGPETEDPDVVPFEIDGIKAGDTTYGHRFLAPGPIKVRRFDDYVSALEKAKVVLDPARRKEIILADAKDLAFAQGLELVEDEGLLNEVAGLVEWPVVLMGEFDEAFLDIPAEVIRATIRANQKCFVLKKRDAKDGALANKFILVSNIVATDNGKAIAAGNGRVVRARLSDALYFWETDRKPLPGVAEYRGVTLDFDLDLNKTLDQRMAKLAHLNVVFHEKLGTQGARVVRIVELARILAPLVGADVEKTARAATLCKADLMTEVVGEFPETQGLMGRRYALLQEEPASVAAALEEHYKPQGPSDYVPSDPVSLSVALTDKLDTLVCFWAMLEKPTGSKDPYALRRAALGVVRILCERELHLNLLDVIADVIDTLEKQKPHLPGFKGLDQDLFNFIIERLKVYLRDKGARHDLIDAVLVRDEKQDDILDIVNRVETLAAFLDTEDGKNLLAGYKRAANILKAEEKKEKDASFDAAYAGSADAPDAEKALASAVASATSAAAACVAKEDFAGAMKALAALRAPVDTFFEDVTVNDADAQKRLNRLRLLSALRGAVHTVADFSKIGG